MRSRLCTDLVERCETPPRREFRDVSNPSVPAGPTTRDSSAPPSLLPFTASKIFSRRGDDQDVAERVRVRERQGIHDPPLHHLAEPARPRSANRADRRPGQRCLKRHYDAISYAGLHERSERFAGDLRQLGLDRGDRVAVLTTSVVCPRCSSTVARAMS